MTAALSHQVRWERLPVVAPVGVFGAALALALAGTSLLPRESGSAPARPAMHAALSPRADLPPTPPAPPPAPREAPPADPSRSPAPPDPACPPRVSVRFERASWTTPHDLAERLRPLRAWLDAHPAATVMVLGLADLSGRDADNELLSQRRAAVVARALRRAGVPSSRMTARGIGSLAAIEGDPSDAASMRRVAIRVRGVAPCAGTREELLEP